MTEFTTVFPPLGRIAPTVGTTSDVFENFPDLRSEKLYAHVIMFQSDPANSGRVYIGDDTLNVSTKVGVNYVLPYGGDSFALDSGMALNTIDVSKFRVALDTSGDGVYVSIQMR